MSMGYPPPAMLLLGLLAVAVVHPLAAQDSTSIRLMGEVRDVETELPVEGAAVKILELERVQMTDRNGFFAFDSVPPGRWTFETSQFGFHTNTEASPIAPRSFLLIRLEARPVEMEGLYVSVVQRLVRRRMAVASRVVAWEKADLEEAIIPDIGSFIRTRGNEQFVSCGGEFSANDLPNCFIWRGQPKRIRLFLDDIAVPSGIGMMSLWALDPRDLWTVEFIRDCGPPELRIYTQRFMDMVESGRVRLAPAICVP